MKNTLLFLLALLVFSCKQKTSGDIAKLSGKYSVAGFKVKTDMEKNGGKLVSILNKSKDAFDFNGKDSVTISSELGETYFSGTKFRYELTSKALYLFGKSGDRTIPYRRDGDILNLYINSNGIDTLQVLPTKMTR